MTIDARIARLDDEVLVTLTGSLTFRDYAGAEELLAAIQAEIEKPGLKPPRTLVFDLDEVSMVDSHWLGMFVRAQRQAESRGLPVALRRIRPPVRRLFDLVQFERVFRLDN